MSKHTVAAGDIGGIGQRAVQNNGELAGERHLGLAHAPRAARSISQLFKAEPLHRPGENDVGRLVECSAHAAVSDLGDATGDVGLARLVLLGGQIRNVHLPLSTPEATGIVDCRGEGAPVPRHDAHLSTSLKEPSGTSSRTRSDADPSIKIPKYQYVVVLLRMLDEMG